MSAQDAQDLQGKNILVTGANSGIGRATAVELARRGGRIFVAARSEEKSKEVIDEIGDSAVYLRLDLGDLSAVRESAEAFLARDEPLHVLINNAGLAGQRGITKSGFELAFGTNHVGHFLFTDLLLDRLKASGPSRIVNVSSMSHYQAKGIDYEAVRKPTKSITGLREYAVSKLANVVHAQELARRLDGTGVTTYSLHPGASPANISHHDRPTHRQTCQSAHQLLLRRKGRGENIDRGHRYPAHLHQGARESGLGGRWASAGAAQIQ